MTAKEYLAIFQENSLVRSNVVRLFEEGIARLQRIEKEAKSDGNFKLANFAKEEAEKAKWEAICFAEYEKEYGIVDFSLPEIELVPAS